MVLKVYDSMSRSIQRFIPWSGRKVGVYVCGPTVYDFTHIGHARTYIAFGVIVRYLRYKGFDVKYVMNITDIDDKILSRAKEKGVEPLKLANDFEAAFLEDLKAVNIQEADVYPRVSDHIPQIISLIKILIEKGYGYEIDGNVYYAVAKKEGYGKLSHQTTETIKSGSRLEVDEKKRDTADFALWKYSSDDELGWNSPWGKGRPGWHIECSTMSTTYLGERFEIHGGGNDLIFPHHENEIAQSEAYSGKIPFVKYWLHTGFLTINNIKMSKSLGNIVTIREFLTRYEPEVLRLLVLSTHYRRPLDYSERSLKQARTALNRIRETIENLKFEIEKIGKVELSKRFLNVSKASTIKQKFIEAMDNDFNTSKASSQLFQLIRVGNKALVKKRKGQYLQEILGTIIEIGNIMGVLQNGKEKKGFSEEISKLITERETARNNKNWEKADKIRNELVKIGVEIKDYSSGTRWRIKDFEKSI